MLVNGLVAPIAQSITAAACMPGLAGVVLDHLGDASLAANVSAIATSQRGATVCPGVATQAAATTLEYPATVSSTASVQLACDRDCLYLVTLDASAGRPVVARRGALRGGVAPALIMLPRAKLGSGPYTFAVQLVAQVNPGAITKLESAPTPVS